MKVILASASPRRRELLKSLFLEFDTVSPVAEEINIGDPVKQALYNAKVKADAVNDSCDLLISADTIVVFEGKILGKPSDPEDAIRTLSLIEGRSHEVLTGVCLKYTQNGSVKYTKFYDRSTVVMKKMSEDEILEYVKSGSPLDKAGSYGIQDGVVESFHGSYTNIVGLPIERLEDELKKIKLL